MPIEVTPEMIKEGLKHIPCSWTTAMSDADRKSQALVLENIFVAMDRVRRAEDAVYEDVFREMEDDRVSVLQPIFKECEPLAIYGDMRMVAGPAVVRSADAIMVEKGTLVFNQNGSLRQTK